MFAHSTARQLARSTRSMHTSALRCAPPLTQNALRSAAAATAAAAGPSSSSQQSRRRRAPSWSHAVGSTALALAAGTATLLYMHTHDDGAGRLQLESKNDVDEPTTTTKRNLAQDVATLLCFVGYPQSGKSTQADKTQKEWAEQGWKVFKDINSVEQLRDAIHQATSNEGPLRVILDGFPRTLDEAKAVEKEIGDIFCYAFFHMEKDEWIKRTGRSAKEYEELKKTLEPLRTAPREKGNIMEIAAHWPSAREVWEMVQAKVEQVLELHERGEM